MRRWRWMVTCVENVVAVRYGRLPGDGQKISRERHRPERAPFAY